MKSIVSLRRIEKELIARNLVPARCRLIEIRMEPGPGALVIRYEVFVEGEQLGLVADALKAASVEAIADDERSTAALESSR